MLNAFYGLFSSASTEEMNDIFKSEIPPYRMEQMKKIAKIVGNDIYSEGLRRRP